MSGTVIGSMDSYIVNTSMPRVLGDLGEPQYYAWVASAFILAQVVGLSIAGAWRDRAGLKTPFLLTVAAFGIGSLLCALAPSMLVLVVARAFQGLAGGGLNALGFAAAAAYPEAVRLRMLSLISGVWGVVALSAPLLGGLITDTLGWRWIFLVNLPLCAAVILLGWLALAASKPSDHRPALPVVRALLLALAVAGLTAAPSASREFAVPLLGIGLIAALAFGRQERRAAVPVIPRETWLGRGPVGSSLRAMLFYVGTYTGAGVFLPLYLVEVRGESTTQAGVVLGIGGFMWTVGSIFAASRTGRWPVRLGAYRRRADRDCQRPGRRSSGHRKSAAGVDLRKLGRGWLRRRPGHAAFVELGSRVFTASPDWCGERGGPDDAHAGQCGRRGADGRAAERHRLGPGPFAAVDRGDFWHGSAPGPVSRYPRPPQDPSASHRALNNQLRQAPLELVLVGAGGRGFHAYGAYAKAHPGEVRFVAVAEPDESRRERFAEAHGIPLNQQFRSWNELAAQPQLARAAVNTTMDRTHHASTLALLAAGYDVLLEKPMATTPAECIELVRTAEQRGRILQICHVLRYAPFFRTIHEIVTSGRLGDIVSFEWNENLAYWHFAHSFVRGRWANSQTSAPMILTKCCHDLDLLVWMLGWPEKVASFGSLEPFPPGASWARDPGPLHRRLPDRSGVSVFRAAHLHRAGSG